MGGGGGGYKKGGRGGEGEPSQILPLQKGGQKKCELC